jgi:hypothetical protein
MLTVTGTAAGGSGFFDPGPGFARRLQASFGGAGVTVTGVTYLSPTSLSVTVNTVGASAGPRTLVVTNPDGQSSSRGDALTITPLPANGPPLAHDDAGTTFFGATLNVPSPGVLTNDLDPDGQPLTVQLVTATAHGSLVLGPSGSVLYTPALGFSGVDSFTYRAFDGVHHSNIATVTIVVGANRAPVFIAAPASRTLYDPGPGVSSGPLPFTVADPDGGPVTISASSSNTAVVPASGLAITGTGPGRAITIATAGAATLGVSTITLTASDGSLTAVATFTVTVRASTAPGAPQNLAADVSRNTVSLRWQPPASPSGEPVQNYVLEAGSTSGSTEFSASLGNVLTLTATVPDAIYFVRVRAMTPAGSGPASNEVQVAAGQAAPPQPPQALLATVQGTAVTLQWTENPLGPVIGAYQLQAGTATGVIDVGAFPLPATQRTLSVDAPAGIYFVRLVAVNAAGVSSPSNEAIVTTGPGVCTIPAVPTGLAATSTAGLVAVGWNAAAAGAIPLGYQLLAGSLPGGADRAVLTVPATTTAVGGPVPAGTYFVRVVAGNACGLSAPSAEVTVTVP